MKKISRRRLMCASLAMSLFGSRWAFADKPPLVKLLSFDRDEKKVAKDDDEGDPLDGPSANVDTQMVGDYTTIVGLNIIVLQGVGLVTGLDGTGGDPPPSIYRTEMLNDMKRRGVTNANTILKSPNTALVLVKAYLPPLIREDESFDIEVRALGNDETSSLNGGWLMQTYLYEEAIVPGEGRLKGHDFGKAEGPIMVSPTDGDKEANKGVLTRGRILGGGKAKKTRELALYLRNDFRSVRNASRIAECIGKRFFNYNEHGLRESLAKPVTDQKVELKLLPRYKDNFPRYLQVIRHLAFHESRAATRVRMQKLQDRLLNPETSEKAGLELEAIGAEAIPILRSGLKSKLLEVRFHSALAMAYMGEADGIPTLAEAAREEPAFRVFSYAAMSSIDDAEAHVQLRDLLGEKSPETRYGAFRAMTILDRNDPFLKGERLNDQFNFHVLPVEGPPMIHMTNHRKAEVVLFGADQKFKTPMAVRAGTKILVTGASGSDKIVISKYEVGKPDRREVVSTRVVDVIRKVAEFGATYPDVAQLLSQAQRQHNCPGTVEIDALPKAGRFYERPIDGGKTKKVRISKPGQQPNSYSEDKDFNPTSRPDPNDPAGSDEPEDGDLYLTEKDSTKKMKAEEKASVRETGKTPQRDSAVQPAGYEAGEEEAPKRPRSRSTSSGSTRKEIETKEPEKKEPARIEPEKASPLSRFNPFNRSRRTNQVEPESLD